MVLPLFHDESALAFVQRDRTTSTQRAWMRYQLEHFTPAANGAALPLSQRWKLFVAPTKVAVAKDRESARGVLDAVFDEVQPEYVLFEDSRYMGGRPGVQEMHEMLAARGELVATIRGESAGECGEPPIDYQEIPDFVKRLLKAECFGPCVEIYRLKKR